MELELSVPHRKRQVLATALVDWMELALQRLLFGTTELATPIINICVFAIVASWFLRIFPQWLVLLLGFVMWF